MIEDVIITIEKNDKNLMFLLTETKYHDMFLLREIVTIKRNMERDYDALQVHFEFTIYAISSG